MPNQITSKHDNIWATPVNNFFVGREAYPLITCPICNLLDVDTWLHVLLQCKQQHIHALITKKTQQRCMGTRQIPYIKQSIKTLHSHEHMNL